MATPQGNTYYFVYYTHLLYLSGYKAFEGKNVNQIELSYWKIKPCEYKQAFRAP